MITELFNQVFLIWTEVPFIQEVSGIYTSPFLDTDELKMALRAQKVTRTFEKQAPGVQNYLHSQSICLVPGTY